jgi:hypothetical protein
MISLQGKAKAGFGRSRPERTCHPGLYPTIITVLCNRLAAPDMLMGVAIPCGLAEGRNYKVAST